MRADALRNAFARLDPLSGWRTLGDAPGLAFDAAGVTLGEAQRRPIADAEPFGSFGGRTLPRGVAVSPTGTVYVADPDGARILVALPGWGGEPRPDGAPEPWPFRPLYRRPVASPSDDPYTLVRPTDVALLADGRLVIVDPGAGRILVLVLSQAAIARIVPLDGEPTAIGFDARGRAYVALAAAGRIVRLRRDWSPDADYAGGAGALTAPSAIAVIGGDICRCRAGDRCGCASEAVDLADGTAFVLDGARVRALDPFGRPVAVDLPETLADPPFVVSAEGAVTRPLPPRDPLHLPGVVVDRRGRLRPGGPPLLARARRIVRPRAATWLAGPLEGDREGFAWDRVVLDLDCPAQTRVVVSTLTSDAALEPERVAALSPEGWSTPLAILPGATPEVLVQSPPGRRLWLRVELFGDGDATPTIRALDVSAPRASSLRFLPLPFHQDPESRSFLDRLLAYFGAALDGPAGLGRGFPARLDPRATPAGPFLDWLGSWFDWRFLAAWPEATRREMIAQAIPFFRMRGTPEGLRRIVRWHTGVADPYPIVIEHFRLRGRPSAPPLHIGGKPLRPLRGQHAHAFTLVLPAAAVADRAQLERLVEAQKPAHTRFDLRLIEPGVRIGRQSSIGVDTLVGGPAIRPLGVGHLGQSIVTTPAGPPAIGTAVLAHSGG